MTRPSEKKGLDLPTILQTVTLVFLLGDRVFLRSDALATIQATIATLKADVAGLDKTVTELRNDLKEHEKQSQIARAPQ